jgi:hypothetical protein
MKEPRYIITVEVNARRINGDYLSTSLDRWIYWSAGQWAMPSALSPPEALEILEAVRMTLEKIPQGLFACSSGAHQVALHQLRKDVESSQSTCSLKAES